MCIPEASATIVFSMAEGDSPNSFSETDSDSVLSGSVCYSTELSEDNEVLSEASLMLDTEEVHPYLFEPEQSSSDSDEEILDITNSHEEQIGNTDWYYAGSLCAASIQNVFLQVHLQFLPVDARVHFC